MFPAYATWPEQHPAEAEDVIDLIYAFASEQNDISRLLLGLSKCISSATHEATDPHFLRLAEQFLPHFKNAIHISEALSQQRHFQTVLQSALDRLPFGAGVINEQGRLLYVNACATETIARSETWSVANRHLEFKHTGMDWLTVIPKGLSDLKIAFTALEPIEQSECSEERLFYFCISNGMTRFVNAHLLEQIYRLTPAEIKVTEAIVANLSTQEAANTLTLKQATIRDHLSSIYSKLEVQRKPDLIRKVLFTGLVAPQETSVPASSSEESPAGRFRLPDGRNLSYREYGQPDGHAVLLLHNVMGSSLEPPPGSLDAILSLGVRLIVPERPGYGDSDPCPGRDKKQVCDDIEKLLQHLGIARIDILGHSMGTQYAIACAEYLSSIEIGRIALVSTLPRLTDIRAVSSKSTLLTNACRIVRYAPFLVKPLLQMLLKGDIEAFYENQLSYLRPQHPGSGLDIALMQDPDFRAYCIANFTQSARQGIDAWAEELKLGLSDWGFEIRNRHTPYQIWHGCHDTICAPETVRHLAKSLNVMAFNLLEEETHYLFARHFNSILASLVRV